MRLPEDYLGKMKLILFIFLFVLLPFSVYAENIEILPDYDEVFCWSNTVEVRASESYWTDYCSGELGKFNPEKEGEEIGKKFCEQAKTHELALKTVQEKKCPAECPLKKYYKESFNRIDILEEPNYVNAGPICHEGIIVGSNIECLSILHFLCLKEEEEKEFMKDKIGQSTLKTFQKEDTNKLFSEFKPRQLKEKESPQQFFSQQPTKSIFGASGSQKFGQQAENTGNINNWPEKAQQMCKKAQDNALKECQAAAYHPGGWYVDRTIEAKGTYNGKPINTFISDQIVGQWDCPPHDLIVNENGEYIEQAKIYSEHIDYSNAMKKTSGGLPPEEQSVQIVCSFACIAWPCPMMTTGGDGKTSGGGVSTPGPSMPKAPQGGSKNCIDRPFNDENGDGKDDRSGRTKEEIIDNTINGKPTIDGGEYAGFKYICEGEGKSWWEFWKKKTCKLGACTVQEIPVKGDPHKKILRICCDCSCGPLMIPPNFDPEDYEPLTTDPFEKVFDPEQPLTPPKTETTALTMPTREELTELIPISCNIIKDKKGSKMMYSFMKGTKLVQKEAPGEPFCDQITDENKNVLSILVTPACSDKKADMVLSQCDTQGCGIRTGKAQCLGALLPPSLTQPAPRPHQERPVSHNCCVLYTDIETHYDPRTTKEYFTPKAGAEALTISSGSCGGREKLKSEFNNKEGYHITQTLPACEMRYIRTTPVNIPQTPQFSITSNEILSEHPSRSYTPNIQPGDPLHIVANYNKDASGLTTIFIVNGVSTSITNIPGVTGSGPTRFSASVGTAQAGSNTVQTILKDSQGNILASESTTFNVASQQNTEQQSDYVTGGAVRNIPEGLIIDMFGRIVGEIFSNK